MRAQSAGPRELGGGLGGGGKNNGNAATLPHSGSPRQPIDAPLSALVLDRTQPHAIERLRGWLGESGTDQLLALAVDAHRYVLVMTVDTFVGDPRYLHCADLLTDFDAVIALFLSHVERAQRLLPWIGPALGVDIRHGISPDDRAKFDRALDEYEARSLRYAATSGSA